LIDFEFEIFRFVFIGSTFSFGEISNEIPVDQVETVNYFIGGIY
jgi:hypothetical protein